MATTPEVIKTDESNRLYSDVVYTHVWNMRGSSVLLELIFRTVVTDQQPECLKQGETPRERYSNDEFEIVIPSTSRVTQRLLFFLLLWISRSLTHTRRHPAYGSSVSHSFQYSERNSVACDNREQAYIGFRDNYGRYL